MKNIYDRLKPKIRKSIQDDLKKYPTSTTLLIKKLKKNSFWQDLNVSDVQKVVLWSHYSLIEISHTDLLYGDRFLVNEDDDYIVSITG
tara:strand:+ start:2079 stop:2342 length:264 start_codon:yes stop_codon:yes gene_type:complete